MKKLYENIEDIHIKGSIGQLSQLVTNIDMCMQKICGKTDELYNCLVRFSGSNAGNQFEKVVNASQSLRDYLFEASYDINQMQNEIVEYQNKIAKYEDSNEQSSSRNPHLVNKNNHVNVEKNKVEVRKKEMIQLSNILKSYQSYIVDNSKEIYRRKNEIGYVWVDSQYRDFSNFIDGIIKKLGDNLKMFDQYVQYLDEKIKGLD